MKRYGFILLILLSACSKNENTAQTQSQTTTVATASVERSFDFAQINHGNQLFQKHCASCHGDEAQGTVNWRQAGADGKFPPPPLNGTAHTWHHSKSILMDTIKKGTIRLGGNMPAWGDKLSDKDIEDIIAWIQSKWPDEIYATWYQRQQQAGSQ